jgi:hypothetical protein
MKVGRPEKYTLEFCLSEIIEIHDRLFHDLKYQYITWHDLIKGKSYSRQRISEWRKEFDADIRFSDTIKKIDDELENRLYILGLKGKANAIMVIFGLKNNYGWKDKQEVESINKQTIEYINVSKQFPDK